MIESPEKLTPDLIESPRKFTPELIESPQKYTPDLIESPEKGTPDWNQIPERITPTQLGFRLIINKAKELCDFVKELDPDLERRFKVQENILRAFFVTVYLTARPSGKVFWLTITQSPRPCMMQNIIFEQSKIMEYQSARNRLSCFEIQR